MLRETWFHAPSHAIVRGTGGKGMSWPELERLVADAEASQDLRQILCHCRSPQDLVLAARRQGYRVTRIDLQNAWLEHQQFPETPVHDALPGTAAWS
ncbi:Nif11-like leader peptide family natural product precursor [Synechococcus sp. BA-132 BA5]|uniref:Nif11-like leader peptide family natural product precursor n=1 Tax=Synechococcus sp. BA-132 BA5 TaxID=3110252 RepID=UPI002B206CAC|nr:Nif11-like leader peptide family natural product precursor [Synechococcus sp. BA-132 BA5]MEA5416986.1 Nif11-like leader peptide family natural product precursor [Synechococcus sp. BA-132 BA5]